MRSAFIIWDNSLKIFNSEKKKTTTVKPNIPLQENIDCVRKKLYGNHLLALPFHLHWNLNFSIVRPFSSKCVKTLKLIVKQFDYYVGSIVNVVLNSPQDAKLKHHETVGNGKKSSEKR